MLEGDERHKCKKPKARRLYIRDYTFYRDIYSSSTKKKQIFIPIGIICMNCGFMIGSLGERLTLEKKLSRQEKRRRDRINKKGLEELAKLGIKKRRAVITHLD